jgi:chromosome segregation protein
MKLKTIELVGFKSFAKKSKLDFHVPVTGVVGPNGSGKSNIVEAFRFVLGEQSMKSLRGKSGKDLIFKGSKDLQKGSRAYVEIVFDNKDRIFKLSDRSEPINLDFDEIILKREVFADGNNEYSINGASVRLKDIIELLSSVNIGSSGHHIVSQGQADRILSSSSKDRRLMVEDALGLKVYQYRLKDAAKKLEKTEENMKEVSTVRRELAPHIKYLKKQVEKVEKGEELRRELATLYLSYFRHEEKVLSEEETYLKHKGGEVERDLKEVEVKLRAHEAHNANASDQSKLEEIGNFEKELAGFDRMKEELSRKIGRIEGMIEFQNKAKPSGADNITLPKEEFENFSRECETLLTDVAGLADIGSIQEKIKVLREIFHSFGAKFKKNAEASVPEHSFKDLEDMKKGVTRQLEEIEQSRIGISESIARARSLLENERSARFKDQEEKFMLEAKKSKLENDSAQIASRQNSYTFRKSSFDQSIQEAIILIGREILNYKNATVENTSLQGEELWRSIERIKIKLEDIGTGSGADIMKEFKEVTERDEFLSKELSDLEKSIENLRTLMQDLKETLEREFKEGLVKINERFEEFFKLMFGGGGAYLSSVVQGVKENLAELDEDDLSLDVASSEENKELDYGIDINVTLPHKKVKDLQMLSGGERSLTSIALVFAITQVNPPPFLVLDETDAALDEANSKRYADMIEKLSKYSQLITVTHNRETMSRAEVIYGVTIGADGSSKLLSIKFAEAENYAK